MRTISVGVKQSCTSAIDNCAEGSSIPAWPYASRAALTTSGKVVKSNAGSIEPRVEPATRDSPLTYIGVSVYSSARSTGTINAHAAPSETPEQSNTPSRPATLAALSIVSTETGERNCALGFREPLSWFFHATWVMAARISSGCTPCLAQYAGSSSENAAGAVIDNSGDVPSLGGSLRIRPEKPESLSFSTPTAITTS